MSLLKSKVARRTAIGLSTVALVAGAALPATVMGQGITLNRCPANGTGGPTSTCVSQLGVPIAAQLNGQRASTDPSSSSRQSNDNDNSARNSNDASALNVNAQAQKAIQLGGDQSNRQSNDQDVDATAVTRTEGGTTLAVGPITNVTFHLSQDSDASAHGDATVRQDTGRAGGDATARGDIRRRRQRECPLGCRRWQWQRERRRRKRCGANRRWQRPFLERFRRW
jgi:hypothetical protein